MAKDRINLLQNLANYAKTFLGTKSYWGGDDIFGLDCSGFDHEVLQGFGLEVRGHDSTANGLYTRLIDEGYQVITHGKGYPGCLVFWFSGTLAIHTAIIAIDDNIIIHAAGSSPPSSTPEQLIKSDSILSKLIKKTDDFAKKSPIVYWILKKIIGFMDAERRNSFVRYDKIDYRGLNYKIIDPTLKVTE